MVGHGSKFTRKKEAAIAALLTHRNVEEAARAAGIGTQTLYRWMKHPEFKAALRKAKQARIRSSQHSAAAGDPGGRHHGAQDHAGQQLPAVGPIARCGSNFVPRSRCERI